MATPSSLPKQDAQRASSRETLSSTNSSCLLQRRKQVHPLAASIRINTRSNIQQRVFSAKMLKLKQLQNQLNDANYHLAQLQQENKALKTLQARQNKALAKYEGDNAELPRLLQSYEEEIRVLQAKNKTFRKGLKEAAELIKSKDEEINNLKAQLKHITNLTKDKHLGEREKLSQQVEDLKIKLKKSEEEISILNRKILMESKNYKFKINSEISKNKQCQRDLQDAMNEIERLSSMTESRTKMPSTNASNVKKRFPNGQDRKSISLVNLDGQDVHRTSEGKSENSRTNTVVDVKLEPIAQEGNIKTAIPECTVLQSPTERIRARLSGKEEPGSPYSNATINYRTEDSENFSTSYEMISPTENVPKGSSSTENNKKIESEHLILQYPSQKNMKKGTHSSAQNPTVKEHSTFETTSNISESIYKNLGTLVLSEKDLEKLCKIDNKDVEEVTLEDLQRDRNKLNVLGENLKASIRKGMQQQDPKYTLDKSLEEYCSSVVNSVAICSDNIEKQKRNFDQNRIETENLLNGLEQVDQIHKQLMHSNDSEKASKYKFSPSEKTNWNPSTKLNFELPQSATNITFSMSESATRSFIGSTPNENSSKSKVTDESVSYDAFDSSKNITFSVKESDIVNQILKEEYAFQREVRSDNKTANKYNLLLNISKRSTEKESEVAQEEKKKLLETLKAIDNGEDVDSGNIGDGDLLRKCNLMKTNK